MRSKTARRPPNILFLVTDQQSLRAMRAYGNPYLSTPHMDLIASQGVRFVSSYCTSPVCGPARASLVTGRMPHDVGVDINGDSIEPSIATMGQVFQQAGYRTAWAGKWHLPEAYPQVSGGAIPGFECLPFPETPRSHMGVDSDPLTAEAAIEFLGRSHPDPFLLTVSLHNPHDICRWVRRGGATARDHKELPPLPDNFAIDPEEPEFIQQCRQRTHYGDELIYTKHWDSWQWRAYLHAYYRFVEQADAQIGRVLDALCRNGLEDNTLIVFTSDHGEGMAAHHWAVKLMLYEKVITVPLIVSWRGITPAGAVCTALASGLDILATLCDYAGVEPPDTHGMSLRQAIEHQKAPGREFVVTELVPDPIRPDMQGRMVRTPRFKYVAFSDGRDAEMLFDMWDDPGETKNLIRSPDAQELTGHHRRLLHGWLERTHDPFRPRWAC